MTSFFLNVSSWGDGSGTSTKNWITFSSYLTITDVYDGQKNTTDTHLVYILHTEFIKEKTTRCDRVDLSYIVQI